MIAHFTKDELDILNQLHGGFHKNISVGVYVNAVKDAKRRRKVNKYCDEIMDGKRKLSKHKAFSGTQSVTHMLVEMRNKSLI